MFEQENPRWLPYCTLLRGMTAHLGICKVSSKTICLTVELSGVSAILTNSTEYYLFYMFSVRLQEMTLKIRRAVIHFSRICLNLTKLLITLREKQMRDSNEFFPFKIEFFLFLLVEVITFKIWMNTQKDSYGPRRIGFMRLREREKFGCILYFHSGSIK